jgi:hypothetical protein
LGIESNPLVSSQSLLEAGFQFGFQFLFCPKGQGFLGPSHFNILADKPDYGFQQPVSGRPARRAVVILLDHDGGEPRNTAEILENSLQHLGAVGDVTAAFAGNLGV